MPSCIVHPRVGRPPDDILGPVREHFLLDPEVVFLNHGSFGACPRPVFERYQAWQRELEREPVEFISRRLPACSPTRAPSSRAYVGAPPDDLTFVPNATTGVNIAARSLDLQPGRRGPLDRSRVRRVRLHVGAVCARAGARYVRAEIPLPLERRRRALFAHATERTRVVYVSHITSETGLLLPVDEIVSRARGRRPRHDRRRRARARRTSTSTSTRSAPTSTPATATNGCARRRAPASSTSRPERQERVDGPIVSWGYGEPATFISRTERQGTRDSAAYLSVPAAIDFVREHDDRERCVALAREARARLCELLGTEPLSPDDVDPPARDRAPSAAEPRLSQRLFDEHRIEIPTMGPRRDDLLRHLDRDLHGAGGRRAAARRPPALV